MPDISNQKQAINCTFASAQDTLICRTVLSLYRIRIEDKVLWRKVLIKFSLRGDCSSLVSQLYAGAESWVRIPATGKYCKAASAASTAAAQWTHT